MKDKIDYYSSEIEQLIIDKIKNKWHFKDSIYDEDIMLYMIIRYVIENKYYDVCNKCKNEDELLSMIMYEKTLTFYNYLMKWVSDNNTFEFENNEIKFSININNLQLVNIVFCQMKMIMMRKYRLNNDYLNVLEYIRKFTETTEIIMKSSPLYKTISKNRIDNYIMYFYLLELNQLFVYKDSYILQNTEEHRLSEIYSNYILMDVREVKESVIEDFLYQNIAVLNEEYEVIGKQVKVVDGTIDILCNDKEGNYIIVELKNKPNKTIVWQSLYYIDEIRKKYNLADNTEIKFIAFCPEFPYSLKSVLEKIKHVEMIKYTLVMDINSNNIVDIIIEKEKQD